MDEEDVADPEQYAEVLDKETDDKTHLKIGGGPHNAAGQPDPEPAVTPDETAEEGTAEAETAEEASADQQEFDPRRDIPSEEELPAERDPMVRGGGESEFAARINENREQINVPDDRMGEEREQEGYDTSDGVEF